MGVSQEAAPLNAAAMAGQIGREFVEAPLRLPVESYADFAAQLHINQDAAAGLSVTEELRRLQIDPEVFYRGAPRLGIRRFSPDDVDPSAPSAAAMSSTDNTGEDEVVEAPTDDIVGKQSFAPPKRGVPSPDPEARQLEDQRLSLNVPQSDEVEEILLEAETHGGRMGHETPHGISAHVQIDSLTDDEDDEDFRSALVNEGPGREEADEVEAFSLDPDFDYDTVANLSRRV